MNVKPRRSYVSPSRTEQVNATRRHILSAAESLFAEHGFATVTMGAIAKRAGVSPANLYLYFPGKVALVAALAEEIVAAPDLSVEHVERETDPVHQLRVAAANIRQLNERSWLVAEVLRSAQGSGQGLTEVLITWQRRHLDAIKRGIVSLESRGALREGLAVDEAVDVFYALAGTEVYRALVSRARLVTRSLRSVALPSRLRRIAGVSARGSVNRGQ
jgi:AcrR family transcriptional regulator